MYCKIKKTYLSVSFDWRTFKFGFDWNFFKGGYDIDVFFAFWTFGAIKTED